MADRARDIFEASPALEEGVRLRCGLSVGELLDVIQQVDDDLLAEEVDVRNRPIRAGSPISVKLELPIMLDAAIDPIAAVIKHYYDLVYGKDHLAIGPLHVGALMIRDMFEEVYVPHIFGSVRIDAWDHVHRLDRQRLNLLGALFPHELKVCGDQIADIFDFAFAVEDQRLSEPRARELLWLCKEQIEGACRTLLGSFSRRVAIQGSCYAVELVGKAALVQSGGSDNEIRSLGHNLDKIFRDLPETFPGPDYDRIRWAIKQLPNVIDERYSFDGLARCRIGHTVRCSQYILGEMGRSFSDRDMRGERLGAVGRVFPPH